MTKRILYRTLSLNVAHWAFREVYICPAPTAPPSGANQRAARRDGWRPPRASGGRRVHAEQAPARCPAAALGAFHSRDEQAMRARVNRSVLLLDGAP
jgi:hypothetical protein